MNSVRNLLKNKGYDVWTVSPDQTIYQALELMAEKNIGALPVTKGEKIVGILSERDYARRVILKGKSSINTNVGDLMVKKVFYVSPDDSIDECMSILSTKKIRHLPVIEDNKLVGMISIGDVVNHIISMQEFEIKELQKYISGSY